MVALGIAGALFVALGVGLLVWLMAVVLRDVAEKALVWISGRRRTVYRYREQDFDPYGERATSWWLWRFVAMLVGVVLFWGLLREWYLAVFGVLAGWIPSLVRSAIIWRRRARVNAQVVHLLRCLNIGVRAYGGITPALEMIAAMMKGTSVGQRLEYLLRRYPEGGEALAALARDLDSAQLRNLVGRLQEATRGTTPVERILRETIDEVEREELRRLTKQIGQLPVRVLVPMLLTLFLPPMVLLMNPPVARLLSILESGGLR